MKNEILNIRTLTLGFFWILALTLHAQQQQQQQRGGGNFQGGGGNSSSSSSSSSSSRTYRNNTQIGDAIITSDPETKKLIVITDEETGEQIGKVISNLDRPKPQVLIKVVFLEVTYRNGLDIGIEGGVTKNINASSTFTGSNLFGLVQQGTTPLSPATTLPGAGIYSVVGNDFRATLRAISEAGKLEVLSRPSILARNNQVASITVGQQVPLITNVRFDTFGNAINTVTYQDVGIILKVTPFITSDGMVQMIVAPQISSLSEQTVTVSAGVNAPVIDLRSADTVVVTPDGQTVVIGGLMQNSKTSTDSKIPWLGDIPWLGALFKHKLRASSKVELLIFLTPYVVPAPRELSSISINQNPTELAPKAFTEKELNQFLDGVPVKKIEPSAPEAKKNSRKR